MGMVTRFLTYNNASDFWLGCRKNRSLRPNKHLPWRGIARGRFGRLGRRPDRRRLFTDLAW